MATDHCPRSIPARIVYRIPLYSIIGADQKCDSAAMERSARFVALLLLRHGGVADEFSEDRDRLLIWAQVSALQWPNWHLRNCWAFTLTSLEPFHSTSPRRSSAAIRHHRISRPTKEARTSSSKFCLRGDAPTQ